MGLSSAETRIVNAKGQLRDTQVRWEGPPSVFRCCSLGAVVVNASTHEDLWETTKVAEQHERARHTEPNSLASGDYRANWKRGYWIENVRLPLAGKVSAGTQ